MKVFSLLLSFLFSFLLLNAQSLEPIVLASAGDHYSAGGVQLSWTLGEMTMVETFTASGSILTQGFHQPEEDIVSIEEKNIFKEFVIYPNPASGLVNIKYSLISPGTLTLKVYSLTGISVNLDQQWRYDGGLRNEQISLDHLSQGVYMFQVSYVSMDGTMEESFFRKITVINN